MKFYITLFLATFSIEMSLSQNQSSSPDPDLSQLIGDSLSTLIEQHPIPGVVAAIVDSRGIRAIGSAGIRKSSTEEPFTSSDKVHTGSCTKAMTSVLLATLVAEGKLRWENTIEEVFPELKDSLHPLYHQVSLWQLLTHRGGVPSNAKNWNAYPQEEMKKRRRLILQENLKEAAEHKPGEFMYSNLGYMIAAGMAEQITDSTWEELIQARLFIPLGMESAGFGPPGTSGQLDEPWGHRPLGDKWLAFQEDNAEALGPAGRVHLQVEDCAKFLSLFLAPDGNSLLDKSYLEKLTDPTGDYAAGWAVVERSWAKGKALSHSGSNTMWFATVWLAPNLNRAYLVAMNAFDQNAPVVCDQMIGKLLGIDQKTEEEDN